MEEILIILVINFFVGVEHTTNMISIKFRCPLDKHFYPCGSCIGTCSNPEPECPKLCDKGLCDCYPEFVRDDTGNCIDYDHCFRSSTYKPTGENLQKLYGCNSKQPPVEACLKNCHSQEIPQFILSKVCPRKCCPEESESPRRQMQHIDDKCL
ncbi:hypothetical protein ILUMI_13357 [Ignelater luminosus]|uniref:TIL domain-containing protein n=1 Tax=Ignelater luminosus TaxID=2038154 RepID=A0A8K0GAZ5_IGNLU|nr:hypothetical protein ILUMI_13357 [Ignelater luminosus]